MKLSNALFLLALAANGACIVGFYWLSSLPGGQGADFLFIFFVFPPIWFITFIVAMMILVTTRFKAAPDNMALRAIAFFFCTPIPIVSLFFGWTAIEEMGPKIFSTGQEFKSGVSYKYETWTGKEGAYFTTEYYKADSMRMVTEGDKAYLKDSVWTYTNEHLDTLKLEFYKDGQLVRTEERGKK